MEVNVYWESKVAVKKMTMIIFYLEQTHYISISWNMIEINMMLLGVSKRSDLIRIKYLPSDIFTSAGFGKKTSLEIIMAQDYNLGFYRWSYNHVTGIRVSKLIKDKKGLVFAKLPSGNNCSFWVAEFAQA